MQGDPQLVDLMTRAKGIYIVPEFGRDDQRYRYQLG